MGLITDDVVLNTAIYKVLVSLIPAISDIDGECSVCIKQFIDKGNQGLAHLKIPFRYEFSRDKHTRKEKVEVIKV